MQALSIQDWNVRHFPCLHLICAPLLPHNMVADVIPGSLRRVQHSSDKRKIIQECACETTAKPVVAWRMGDARQAIQIMRIEFPQTAPPPAEGTDPALEGSGVSGYSCRKGGKTQGILCVSLKGGGALPFPCAFCYSGGRCSLWD